MTLAPGFSTQERKKRSYMTLSPGFDMQERIFSFYKNKSGSVYHIYIGRECSGSVVECLT